MMNLMFLCLFVLAIIAIAIIDKKEHRISKIILLVGFIIEAMQIIVNANNNESQLAVYIAYLVPFMLLIVIDTITLRTKGESFYIIQILLLSVYMATFLGIDLFIISLGLMLAIILLVQLAKFLMTIRKRKVVKTSKKELKLPIGTYLCSSIIIVLLISIFVL